MTRFVEAVTKTGLTVFARIDHAASAAKIGTTLCPTEVLVLDLAQQHGVASCPVVENLRKALGSLVDAGIAR